VLLLDALPVRCVLLPAVLEMLGGVTWRLPHRLDERIAHISIEGSAVHSLGSEVADVPRTASALSQRAAA
jgi:hypothetical protein